MAGASFLTKPKLASGLEISQKHYLCQHLPLFQTTIKSPACVNYTVTMLYIITINSKAPSSQGWI